MRKILSIALSICLAGAAQVMAQCPGGRYKDKIFAVNVSTVTYSTPYGLQMDIYQPAADTMSARPLIILAHGGSFVGGSRNTDATVDTLCKRFAQRGYVTASIDYRLGNLLSMALDSTKAISEVVHAISDGKAAIRYFVKDAATSNSYKIDTNNIFIGGNSAGAVLYMHVGYFDSLGEVPSYISDSIVANGGFEGNSGNAGYTTKSKAIINLAGGLNRPSFIGPGNKPSVNAHGNNDNVVPYTCALSLSGSVQVTLCGLGSLEPVYVANSIYHMSKVFAGDGHVPWDSDPLKQNTVDSLVTEFLYSFVCVSISSVNEVNNNTEVSIFPNPAHEVMNLQAQQPIREVTMLDETGRTLYHAAELNKNNVTINTATMSKGLYFVRLKFVDEGSAALVKKVVIE